MEVMERNARLRQRMALFEIGPVFQHTGEDDLPREPQRVALLLAGPRSAPGWQPADTAPMDFYDLKGVLEALLNSLHIPDIRFEPGAHPSYHPGKCARILSGSQLLGISGELHPLARAGYDLPVTLAATPLLAAELDLDALQSLILILYDSLPVPEFPPVLEDLAVVVEEGLPAERVEQVIRAAGGKTVTSIRLFDVYRGGQVGAGMKSLAYSLTYQAADRTLTDKEAAQVRQRVIRQLEQELGAKLRA